MHPTDLQLLYAYNRWANARVLAACQGLTPDQLFAPAQASFGSLMGTLAHTFTTERFWRLRLEEGISLKQLESANAFPSLEVIVERWREEEVRMQRFIESLDPYALDRWVEYTTTSGKPQGNTLWKALTHLVFHGMQFRAEAGVILSAMGRSPGDIDLLYFLRETDQR